MCTVAIVVLVAVLQAWVKEQVTSQMFSMLHNLQHPANCSAARKLVCNLNKPCGFGCQMHHVVHCFTHAVALNRTLIMEVSHSSGSQGNLCLPVTVSCGQLATSLAALPACGRLHSCVAALYHA